MAINRAKVLEKAEKLVRQGKTPAAVIEFRALLKDQPTDLNTINRLGDLLAKTNKTGEAIELFSRAAQLYTAGGFFLKAIAIYKKILKLDPAVVEPRMRLADLYARRDLTMEARAEYIAVAEKLVRDGNEIRAREVYDKLIRMEPGNVMARTALADIYAARGDAARALEELRSAARDLESLGLAVESAAIYRRVLTSVAAEAEAQAEAVRGIARAGAADEAVEAAKALRERVPDDTNAAEALVEALELAGRAGEAEELVKSALSDAAEHAIPKLVLGRLHARAGRMEVAEPLLLAAADELLATRRTSEATRALDALLEADPENRGALDRRLQVARNSGGGSEATDLSTRVVSQFGDSSAEPLVHDAGDGPPNLAAPKAAGAGTDRSMSREEKDFLNEHITEAEVFVKYRLYDKAIEPLQAVLGRFPGHLEAHQRLKAIYAEQGNRPRFVERCLAIADIHEGEGRPAEAVAVLVEARNLDADNNIVRARLERLEAANKTSQQARPAVAAPATSAAGADVDIAVEDEIEPFVVEPTAYSDTVPGPEPARRSGEENPHGILDLAGDLGDSLADVLEAEGVGTPPPEEQDFGEIFKAFQQRVEEVVEAGDFKTHYDLAIAYKEMGLVDEAISEFQYAARDPERLVECGAMLGLCFREKGMPAQAEKWYRRALESEKTTANQQVGLRFELAEAYVEMGDFARAKETFRLVESVDSTYRDVAARIAEVDGMA